MAKDTRLRTTSTCHMNKSGTVNLPWDTTTAKQRNDAYELFMGEEKWTVQEIAGAHDVGETTVITWLFWRMVEDIKKGRLKYVR